MLLFYFYFIFYFNILLLLFRPHKIKLRLSEDSAGASTSKKSCRRPQSRRIEQEKVKEIELLNKNHDLLITNEQLQERNRELT